MSLFLKNLSEEFDVPLSDVEEVWEMSREEIEREKGISREEFVTGDFRECERRTRVCLEADSLVRISDFFESGMDAGQFLETLVSGNFANVQNIVNRNRDEFEEDEEQPDPGFVDMDEEEEIVDESDEDDYIDEEEETEGSEIVPDIMTESEALQILGASAGIRTSGSVPKCLQ